MSRGSATELIRPRSNRPCMDIKLSSSCVEDDYPCSDNQEARRFHAVRSTPKHPAGPTSLAMGHGACSDHAKSLSSHAEAVARACWETQKMDGVGTQCADFMRRMFEFLECEGEVRGEKWCRS